MKILIILLLFYIKFHKGYSCGFVHSWSSEDSLRHYGLLKEAEFETLAKNDE